MKTSAPVAWKHLSPNPKSCYRQLFVTGTRIRARVIYGMFMSAEEPMTPEEIAVDLNLPIEAVREAISYCQGQPGEIVEDLEREERIIEASGNNRIVPPSEIARALNT